MKISSVTDTRRYQLYIPDLYPLLAEAQPTPTLRDGCRCH